MGVGGGNSRQILCYSFLQASSLPVLFLFLLSGSSTPALPTSSAPTSPQKDHLEQSNRGGGFPGPPVLTQGKLKSVRASPKNLPCELRPSPQGVFVSL